MPSGSLATSSISKPGGRWNFSSCSCGDKGPSGYEDQVRDLVKTLVADYADEIRTDALGNL
ncbi:MAG TPA: hypothetical protein EYP56_18055, partial [Planctomycetaceae bacterium]|nr:hypothetical protein [Planctomycetaceae bacterium]